jgi:hypothetical protein
MPVNADNPRPAGGSSRPADRAADQRSARSSGQSSDAGWPGVDEAEVAAASARIARHLARTGVRTVGLLPISGSRLIPTRRRIQVSADLAPLLERLALALAGFVGGTVGFVAAWKSWGTAAPGDGQPTQRIRQVSPDVAEIVPPRCSDPRAAATALQRSLASVAQGIPHVLIDLGDYAPQGRIPAVAGTIDLIVPAITARVTDQLWVMQVWKKIPDDKRLGAILIG